MHLRPDISLAILSSQPTTYKLLFNPQSSIALIVFFLQKPKHLFSCWFIVYTSLNISHSMVLFLTMVFWHDRVCTLYFLLHSYWLVLASIFFLSRYCILFDFIGLWAFGAKLKQRILTDFHSIIYLSVTTQVKVFTFLIYNTTNTSNDSSDQL